MKDVTAKSKIWRFFKKISKFFYIQKSISEKKIWLFVRFAKSLPFHKKLKNVFVELIFTISLVFCLFLLSEVVDASPKDEFLQEYLVEDFEESRWTESDIRIHGNPEIFPEIKKSKTLTSPNLLSNTSLFFRFPKGSTNQNLEIRFPNPRLISDYVLSLKFQIFANSQGGSLSLLLEDARFENHILLIGNLNFSGWKEFIVKLNPGIHQESRILGTSSRIRILGIIYTPDTTESKSREDLLAIDDIFAITLPKIKLPKEFLELKY